MKINHAILHILDFDSAVNVMSQRELDIESRTVRNFVTTHLRRARTSADNKRATFAENSAFGGELKGYFFGEREFVDLSQQIAEFISSELTKAEKAESTDVLVADFDDDEDARWFAVMLLGSKQAFMHEVGREEGEVRNDIARHYAILPNPSQKVPSYAIVRASTMEIGYVDKKRKIAGEDRMLIPDGLLQCDTGVSGKEVIDTVTRVVEEVAEEHGANTAVALAKVKAAVAEKVEDDEELPPWDGQTDYISQASGMVHVKDPAKQSLWASCFKKWFVAMVASWMADEVTNHEILVLIGRQGIYKTTWIDRLMPPQLVRYRSKQSATGRLDKDEMLRFCEFGLINMDEIDSMPDREVNTLKSLITSDDIIVRAVYATNKERRIRLASYAASGNKEQFLTDTSGNRRWLPFEIESIDSPFEHPLPYAGIYAQAYQLSKDGFRHWFDLDEIKGLEEHVEGFMEETNEGQLIPVYFAVPTPGQEEAGNAIFLTLAEIGAKLTVWGAIRRPLSLRQLGKVMTVFAEEASKQDKTVLTGRADNNMLVHFKGTEDLIGQMVPVKITENKTFYLIGERM